VSSFVELSHVGRCDHGLSRLHRLRLHSITVDDVYVGVVYRAMQQSTAIGVSCVYSDPRLGERKGREKGIGTGKGKRAFRLIHSTTHFNHCLVIVIKWLYRLVAIVTAR